MAYAIDGVFPEPLAHTVGVGVDEQHTECGAADGVDEAALRDAKVLEPHKSGDRHQQGKRHIAVRNHIVLRHVSAEVLPEEQDGHNAQHADNDQPHRNPSPELCAIRLVYAFGIFADVRCHYIYGREPTDGIHFDIEYFRHKRIDRKHNHQQQHQQLVHPPVDIVYEHIEERDE